VSNVRLRFAGTIGFLANISGLLTGLIFTTLITRNLSSIEFGQWSVIGSLITVGIYPVAILGYWYTRYTARDKPIANLGILLILLFSLIGLLIYFIVGKIFISEFDEMIPILIVAAIQVPLQSLLSGINKISNGIRPEFTTYGRLIFEISKVTIAFVFVFSHGISLLDAIIIIIIADIIQLSVILFLIRKELFKKVNIEDIKLILKRLWIPLYQQLGLVFQSIDLLIVNVLLNSYPTIALFKISMIFSTIILYSNQLIFPLYVKLLGGGKAVDIEISTKLLLMIAIPLTCGIIVIAKPLLFLLNPDYIVGENIVRILSLYSFVYVINSLFTLMVLGSEKIDMLKNIKVSEILRSSLFIIPSIDVSRLIIYNIALVIFIYAVSSENIVPENFGINWALILFLSNIVTTGYIISIAMKKISFKFPWKNISKYILSAIVMTILLLFSLDFIIYNEKTLIFVFEIIKLVLIGTMSYFIILITIDKETRDLLIRIIKK
jgi:O-antigen/teichoic acid export membrane protein